MRNKLAHSPLPITTERRWLAIILILFTLLGFIYATVTPIFEASDELWHYPFVRHLADGNPLPIQDPENVGPWKQEASQQPLYYALAAALTFWIDTSDMETVRWLNPHVDNGVLTPDGNANLIIHRPELERFPWQGTVLAVHLIRLASVLMGAGTVYFTWRIARIVLPGRPGLALGAAALNAFTPMFLFISGAVNNDNLAILLCAAGLWLILRNSQKQDLTLRDSLTLGIVVGLAALTKTSAIGLIPLAGLGLLVSLWQVEQKSWRQQLNFLIRHGLLILVPVLLIAGWWYIRNLRLYGDWLGWNAFIQILGQRSHPASLRQLWAERWGFTLSYWGLFGGVNVPMPEWIYHLLNAALVIGVIGSLFFAARIIAPIRHTKGRERIAYAVQYIWPLAMLAAWIVAVFLGVIRWATVTWSSQGRLVFVAISAISIVLTAGCFSWLPKRISCWGTGLLGGFMLLIAAIAPFGWIAPAYRPPAAPTPADIQEIQHPLEVDWDGRLRLLGYDLSASTVEPGQALELVLYWEVLVAMDQDWSVFVHLNDPVINAPVAQRDMYPGAGLLATQLLEPGQLLTDRYMIKVPGTAYAPAETELVIGFYNFHSGERLPTIDGRDAFSLQKVQLVTASASQHPNPVHYNFGDQLALVGYHVEPRRLRAGDNMTLTLYWEALDDMQIDYTAFTHLRDLEDPSNHIYAQHDAQLPNGSSNWAPGQVVEAVYQLSLAQDTPTTVHEIEVGVYYQASNGSFSRLQMITPDGRPVDDFLILGKVRVD